MQLFVEHENVDRQEEDQGDGDRAVEDEYHGELIQNHAEEAGGEGDNCQPQQQPMLCSQFLSVGNGMDDAEQQEDDGCQLMDMDTGEGEL